MSELHFLVVFDTETSTFRVGSLDEGPTDSRQPVWDIEADKWRRPTDEESSLAVDAEGVLIHAVKDIGIPVSAEPGSLADRLVGGL
jgi:hypothetical protein